MFNFFFEVQQKIEDKESKFPVLKLQAKTIPDPKRQNPKKQLRIRSQKQNESSKSNSEIRQIASNRVNPFSHNRKLKIHDGDY